MNHFTSGEEYYDVTFSKLEQPEQQYQRIEFEECLFVDCDFSGAKFLNCKFLNCEFQRCNLSIVNVANSQFFGITWNESKLVGIDWTRAQWPVYHLDFELRFQRCILNDSSFFSLTLHELHLEECKLHDVDFREGNFQNSSMTYCDFSYSQFMRTNLQHVDFTESTDYAINVLENAVKGAKFSRYEALNLLECLGIELVD